LKVINARFIGDESTRRRFVREARAAARVRHSNVASVFHLGTSGDIYFYAMEFVEGEPLDNIIRHSARLEAKLALEITIQVASGLSAVHKQNLVQAARFCYERADSLCRSLNRPLLLYVALIGQWRYSLLTDVLSATMQIAQRVYSLAQEQSNSMLMIGAYRALASTLYFSSDFDSAQRYAMCGLDVARGRSTVSGRRGQRARRRLPVL
jgi:hypothetical protein